MQRQTPLQAYSIGPLRPEVTAQPRAPGAEARAGGRAAGVRAAAPPNSTRSNRSNTYGLASTLGWALQPSVTRHAASP
jgi:hypothetical protein